jgi:CheY-like chemotaxis protein
MPSLDGWDILQQLRRVEPTASVPIVVCSVLGDRALAESLGASRFVAKPLTQRALLAVLDDLQATPTANPAPPGDTRRTRPR